MDYNIRARIVIAFISITIVFFASEVESQNDITLELLQSLQNRIDAVNATNRNYQGQINNLQTQLQNQIAKENADFQEASNAISYLEGTVSTLSGRLAAAESGLADANSAIDVLDAALMDVISRVTKLEGVNKIWRANFQVVNRTFAELRKKFKLVIPILQLPVFVVRTG